MEPFEGCKQFAGSAHWLRFLLLAISLAAGSAQASIEQQRDLFNQAERALHSNDLDQFTSLKQQLGDYPIVAYLEYDAFKKNLPQATPAEVRIFLESYQDFPFRYHLLSSWLRHLAKQGRWQEYLEFYDDRSATQYKCHWITARIETGDVTGLNDEIRTIWLTGYSQPDACDPAFAYFLEHQPDVEKFVWQRIEKAFAARRPSLARYLAGKLPKAQREVVETWYQAHKNPVDSFPKLSKAKDTALNRKILVHALKRMARRDSVEAGESWQKVSDRFKFSAAQKLEVEKKIALSAALQHRPEGKELLEALPASAKNDTAHLWLARIYLRDEDWIGLIRTIDAMPQHLRDDAEWIYWQARSYEGAGHQVKADDIMSKLANRSTYHGFLAADRMGKPYRIRHEKVIDVNPEQNRKLLGEHPNLLRARELFFVGRKTEARREWFQGIRRLSSQQIKQAASMAHGWKWHDNAIKTVAKTSHTKDYDLRFPMPYQEQVMSHVDNHDLDPSIVYGIMRRESLFDPLAQSRVGALGLMQLMPATARSVARKLGLGKPARSEILKVDNNIRLGTQYFKTVLDRFDNNIPLAAASYNAGPHNVKRWLPEDQSMSADQWIETVPYKETRKYIKAVLAYATIFDRHLGKDVLISSRMDDVQPEY